MILKDKVALVTGATGGIGACIVEVFRQQGATVVGTYYSAEDYQEEAVDYYKLDVSDYKQCEEVVFKILEKYGKIDILVNAAGITQDALASKMTEMQFDRVISVNLKGSWNLCQLVGKVMMNNGYGAIVNIGSVVGKYGNIGQTNYAASKSGLIGMSQSFAKELAMKGANIRVNVISPGYTKTHMLDGVPEKLLEKFANMTTLKRLAEPTEIANVALFLASDMSSYVTGTVIDVDGGMRL